MVGKFMTDLILLVLGEVVFWFMDQLKAVKLEGQCWFWKFFEGVVSADFGILSRFILLKKGRKER
jgi:hypothetical protein